MKNVETLSITTLQGGGGGTGSETLSNFCLKNILPLWLKLHETINFIREKAILEKNEILKSCHCERPTKAYLKVSAFHGTYVISNASWQSQKREEVQLLQTQSHPAKFPLPPEPLGGLNSMPPHLNIDYNNGIIHNIVYIAEMKEVYVKKKFAALRSLSKVMSKSGAHKVDYCTPKRHPETLCEGAFQGLSNDKDIATSNTSYFPRNDMNKVAFTLAEVLITLGIIGIVAAMTLPGLIQKQEEISTITKYKKMYSTLANAHNAAVAKYGDPKDWDITTPKQILERYGEFLKVNEKCYAKAGCISFGDFVSLNGVSRWGNLSESATSNRIRLNGGFSLFTLSNFKAGCEYDAPFTDADGNPQIEHITDKCSVIYGVINETKKGRKNLYGKDHFVFIITPKGLYPYGYKNSDSYVKTYCSKEERLRPSGGIENTNGESCGTYIMRFNNAKYIY